MRIFYLLLLGISISLTAALSKVEDASPTTTAKPITTHATKSTKSPTTEFSKSPKTSTPGENRGKRTLYDFGNAGYLYSNIASRRAGYPDDGPQNYYPQNGYYNGQSAFAQYPQDYSGHYSPYPQYLEAPEPIIEIIIKDSNETLPTLTPEPIITKKKKEKVHVFYVNYKKDHNNKLHLESPIASLNNDDASEEEEEILQIPVPVTQPPPLKTTTLRTIIHPDSEKYHSNSGIHVTFGSEDKSQSGHILEEHNAESIQNHVVALPGAGSKQNALNGLKTDGFSLTNEPRSSIGNQIFEHPFQRSHYYQTEQQLPAQHGTHFFRTQNTLRQSPSTPQQSLTDRSGPPQFFQKLPNSQSSKFFSSQAPLLPQPQALHQKGPTTQQQLQQQQHQQQHQQQQHQQAHYYANFNQQFQPQTTFSQPSSLKLKQPLQSSFVYPTVPSKLQELPSRQSPTPYQPIKFRPTPVPLPQIKPVPIPAKLENTNYQTQQYNIQPNYQKQQSTTHHQPQQQQHQQPPQKKEPQQKQQQPIKAQPQSTAPYYFNRQPQYVRNPTFSLLSPTIPSYYKTQAQSNTNVNSYQQTQSTSFKTHQQNQNNNAHQTATHQQNQQQPYQQPLISATLPSSATNVPANNAHQSISAMHNVFNIKPSKETELLKSIPKFEQHITETVHHSPATLYQSQTQHVFSDLVYTNRNQVIHDIPAPNLGPTTPSSIQQGQTDYLRGTVAPVNGHYITASNLQSQREQQQQYSNQVSNSLPPATTAPQFSESTNGQKIMIVTPMPPIIYNHYHSSQYVNQDATNNQEQYTIPSQYGANYVQQPRQSQATAPSLSNSNTGTSPFSVSTHHSDVFRELEQRQHQHQQHNVQQNNQQHQEQQNIQQGQSQQASINAQQNTYVPQPKTERPAPATTSAQASAQPAPPKAQDNRNSQNAFQLPDEVPDDLRQQLLSSGILNNADISVLDYDKVGAVNLENLPAEHLQHFYGNGGGAQISESNKVLTVVKPNGEKVSLSEKEIERVKASNTLPKKHNLPVKVVHFDSNKEKGITDKYLKADATVLPPVDIADQQYNRYLPLKVNGAQFPIPDVEELQGKKIVSVVVLAPVDGDSSSEARSAQTEAKEVKFMNGDLIRTLVKKPTKENFKRWLEREAKTDIEQQSVVLLVTSATEDAEKEIFMYDVSTGAVNKLNGDLSSKFVSVAEENASSEDLEHASTLDPGALEKMMQPSTSQS